MTGARRAITLLEVVVVIALLLALAAIAIPTMFRELAARRFDTAVDAIAEGLLLARAHAQAMHQSIEVLYGEDEDGLAWIEARRFEPERSGHEEVSSDVPEEEPLRIAEPWAMRDLPTGVRIEAEKDEAVESDAQEREEIVAGAPASPSPPIRLALFVADGSALVGEKFRLLDEEGRAALWTIDIWTGLPKWEDVEREGDAP